ncbi:hypothetical protein FQA39_LY11165 [Lamprigera yunnana]|nr:hypothetical protein FQA39_LY11165 [Lamprigera yunnana]
MTSQRTQKAIYTVEDLPDEVLEFILSLIPPYKDLHDCLQVSKRWRRCVLNVAKTRQRNLSKSISEFDIAWQSVIPIAMAPTITKRYSHAAVVHDNSMYVFGGCTCSMTTFNDLWRLDLSKRQWVRPLTMGTYPSPKACCTMICYKDLLVLFGGWTHPASYPLHQTWHLFNELHVYDIKANKWNCINTENLPPPTAGHSVSVHGKWMVVFGGLQRASNVVHSTKSNDIWKLNLETWIWYKQETIDDNKKPVQRYGQSQTMLDDEHLLMMGGTGGAAIYYSDVWILQMSGELWKWLPVEVRNAGDAPPNLWCIPVCKVGNKIVVLSRSRQNHNPRFVYYSKGVWLTIRGDPDQENNKERKVKQVDKDENVNGKRGTFSVRQSTSDNPQPGPSHVNPVNNSNINNKQASSTNSSSSISLSAFNNTDNNNVPKVDHRRERRLENLRRLEEKLKKQMKDISESWAVPSPKKQKRNVLGMYVLDISHALDPQPYVTWLPVKNNESFSQGPEETVLYSLVAGKSELIMFGGIQKDVSSLSCTTNNLSNQVTNSLHFITAPKYII